MYKYVPCEMCLIFLSADYAVGFGGKFGVQKERQDKSALGWAHKEEVKPHESQTGSPLPVG